MTYKKSHKKIILSTFIVNILKCFTLNFTLTQYIFPSELASNVNILKYSGIHCYRLSIISALKAQMFGHPSIKFLTVPKFPRSVQKSVRHISSTRHTHLSDIFPGCSHGADPVLSLDFEPDTVFDLCALESACMAEIKRYKSSIRIRISHPM